MKAHPFTEVQYERAAVASWDVHVLLTAPNRRAPVSADAAATENGSGALTAPLMYSALSIAPSEFSCRIEHHAAGALTRATAKRPSGSSWCWILSVSRYNSPFFRFPQHDFKLPVKRFTLPRFKYLRYLLVAPVDVGKLPQENTVDVDEDNIVHEYFIDKYCTARCKVISILKQS